ncbi:MAG: hypothetical protein ACRDBM_12980 [Sporomusa sp.]
MSGQLTVDFGNSYTVIAYWRQAYHQAETLYIPRITRPIHRRADDDGKAIYVAPCLIHYQSTGQFLVGQEAAESLGGSTDRIVFKNLRLDVITGKRVYSPAGGRRLSGQDIACDYLSSVVRQAGQVLGVNSHSVIVFTVPAEACASDAVWRRYSRWLEDVVRQAGYTRLELIEQPLAAAWGAGMPLKAAERFLVIDIEDDCIEAAVAQVALRAGSSDARRLRIVAHGREWLTEQEEVADCEQLLQRILRQADGLGCAGGALAGIIVTGSSRWCSGLRDILQRLLGGVPLYDRNLRQAAACGAAALTAGSDACGYIRHSYGVRYLDNDKYHYRQLVPGGTFYPSDGPIAELTIKASYQDQQQFALFICRLEDSYCVNEDSPLIITVSAPVGCGLPAIYAGVSIDGAGQLRITAYETGNGRLLIDNVPAAKLI